MNLLEGPCAACGEQILFLEPTVLNEVGKKIHISCSPMIRSILRDLERQKQLQLQTKQGDSEHENSNSGSRCD